MYYKLAVNRRALRIKNHSFNGIFKVEISD